MAAQKKIAFAREDFEHGKADAAIEARAGQRLDLTAAQFKALEKDGLIWPGVPVRMLTAVAGARYDLRAGSVTWLPEHVAQAWEEAGHCRPGGDDPDQVDRLSTEIAEARAKVKAAQSDAEKAQDALRGALLEIAAATAQVARLADVLSPFLESDSDDMAEAKAELRALIDMLPDQAEIAPQLDL